MRILHVTDRLSQRGGADWHLLGVLAELARQCEVRLVVGRDDGTTAAPCPVEVVEGLDAQTPEPVASALDALAERWHPDVVHVHNAMNPVALAWAAAREAVMTVQDHRSFCPGRGKLTLAGEACREPLTRAACDACFTDDAYYRRIDARTRERLDAVQRMRAITVLSHYMKGELAAAGVDASRIEVVPPFVHGLDVDAAPSGPPCVLFAGRLVAAKGADDAVAAWQRAGVGLPLVVAGTGPERQRIEAIDGVEVLGWVPHAEVSSVYARARAVLVPSVWQEPFGIVGLEALAMGVPVVAYDSGGIREWCPPDGLVPWRDVDALARALAEAVTRRAVPAPGFDRDSLMARLRRVYDAL